jgi:hypothetical protein
MLIDGAQDERGQGKIPGDFNFLSDQHVEGAGENQLRFQVRLDQARDFRAEHRPAVRLEGAKAVKAQDRRLMPRHGLLGVVGQINPLQGHSDPIGDVREVASMEGRDRVESLGGLEVAAAQEKDQLIACRAQARGNVLERRGKVEAAFTFDAIENRREVEHLALDAVEDLHARHGRLLSLRGSHFTWQAKRGREYDFAQSPKDEVGMHPKGLTDSQIQLISGHESKKSLEIYQHLSLQSVDKAYQEAVQNAGI